MFSKLPLWGYLAAVQRASVLVATPRRAHRARETAVRRMPGVHPALARQNHVFSCNHSVVARVASPSSRTVVGALVPLDAVVASPAALASHRIPRVDGKFASLARVRVSIRASTRVSTRASSTRRASRRSKYALSRETRDMTRVGVRRIGTRRTPTRGALASRRARWRGRSRTRRRRAMGSARRKGREGKSRGREGTTKRDARR